jgi:molybdenum cofactor synthesis domain-containing protein
MPMSDACPVSTKPVTACVLIIGNEILSGRTRDANLAFIATTLNEVGIQVRESRIIPDVDTAIIDTLNAVRDRFDHVFTTGGIGPTHDDITAECVARAFGVPLVMDPVIEASVRAYAERRKLGAAALAASLRMARVPQGAGLLPCGIGTPGFVIGNVHVMAGIPEVMQSMLRALAPRLRGGHPVRTRSVRAEVGESVVASALAAIQARYADLDIGSYPFSEDGRYGTTLVLRGTDEQRLDAALAEVRAILPPA